MIRPIRPRQAKAPEFTQILKEMRPFWQEVSADPETSVAEGVLPSELGIAYKANITFDNKKKHVVKIMVRLPFTDTCDLSRQRCFWRFQNRPHGLTSVVLDFENGLLLFTSSSVLPDVQVAGTVISHVVADLLETLEDEDLRSLLN